MTVFVVPKMNVYIKTLKNGDADKDKNKKNKLMSFHIDDDDKLLRNIKPFGLRLKNGKKLNWKLSLFMIINVYKPK